MIRDLILSFCLLTLFTFFFEHFMMRVNINLRVLTGYTWKVGIYQGLVGVILIYAVSHPFNNCLIADLSTIPILIAASIGGPFASALAALLIILPRLIYEPSIKMMIVGIIDVSIIFIVCNITIRYIHSFWKQWIILVTVTNLLLILFYKFIDNSHSLSTSLQFLAVYEASGLFIAAKLFYMCNAQRLKQRFDEMQSDLLEILHLQPGLIYKLTKENEEFKYKIAGGALCVELGISSSELIGKTLDRLDLFPEDLSIFMKIQKEKAWAGEPQTFEILFKEHTLLINLNPVFYDNIVGAIIGSVIDISQRTESEKKLKESEELYRSLVESTQDFIVWFDVQGRITSVNNKVAETLRISPESLIGTMITEQMPAGEHVEQWFYYFRQVISNGTMERFEYSFRSARREHQYDVTLSPFFNMKQEVIGVITTGHDITHVKKSRAADEANKAKSEFLARMSHEIRTPLSGIIGLTELLTRQEMSPVQKDYLNKILSSSHTLLGIINDVLDLSKIEAGKIELQKVNFNLHQLMQELSDILAVLLGSKQLKFIIDTSADIPEMLYGDSLRVEQILINMINNAIKFTDRGHIYVKVEPVRYEEDSIHLEFSVEDTGIGLTRDQIDHLFEPFMQVRHYSRQMSGGTGLGLPICKYFVELMEGDIEISSEPGQGSKFSFTIPFEYARSDELLQREKRMEFSQTRVLVIENNAAVRNGLCSMLESMNFDVAACEQSDLVYSRLPVEVIVVDLSMNEREGVNEWLQLQKIYHTHPVRYVVISTAGVRDGISKLPASLQPDALILMPVSRNGLYLAMCALFKNEPDSSHEIKGSGKLSLPGLQRKILLAEDNEINQLVITELLTSYGFEVTAANDGREALALLEHGGWDLLLLDIHMPELSGVEVTKRIRQNQEYDHLPVIALTANTVKEEHEMYYRIGMNGVLTKPLQVDALIALLNRRVKGIDYQLLLQRVSGKENIVRYMFTVFIRDYKLFAEQLRDALNNDDLTGYHRMLHTFKGVAGNLCADRLLTAAVRLERELEQDADLQNGLDNLEDELLGIISSIQHYLDNAYPGDSKDVLDHERVLL
ncbi:PAS domain-containing hybrid sensor histidine kinase/response regulator [Paenibacillus sp. IHB B 3415]|uniref:PAS domain-containing hybrid sensor histidine kinase/response regulator n=1 Tax=Paenibacillus sp. IHB B 3415 TaxID=867080 RepID=UPI00069BBDA6|nr:PAS domain-containing hybrid sensor histidine kinase/response regulator [Paenibacillus sp. IHB B 3415]